jgi:hypothetical protein
VGTFPSVFDEPSVTVSVVVPAYNEDQRMAPMMTEMLDFLEETERKDKCVASLLCSLATKHRDGHALQRWSAAGLSLTAQSIGDSARHAAIAPRTLLTV